MPEPRGNIVVIEDDAGQSRALSRLLQVAGFTTSAFDSAEAALASSALGDADCVVTDIHLPGMSGLDLHACIRASGTPPFIVVTADADDCSRQRAQAIGAVAYLLKPLEGRALLSAVGTAVGMSITLRKGKTGSNSKH